MQTFSSAHIDPVNVRRQVELTYIQADNISPWCISISMAKSSLEIWKKLGLILVIAYTCIYGNTVCFLGELKWYQCVYLFWGEIMQELADIVAILALPVVACPSYTVGPAVRTVCNKGLVNSLKHLHRLSTREFQSSLHKLRIPGKKENSKTFIYTIFIQSYICLEQVNNLRKVLHCVLWWLFKQSFKLIASPLNTKKRKCLMKKKFMSKDLSVNGCSVTKPFFSFFLF